MIVNHEIEKYLEIFRNERDPVQIEMEIKAEREKFPIIGPDVGNLLYLLAKISKANSVLELGSGFGYSAYYFAKALPENGKIVCTDMEEVNKMLTEENFRRGGFKCSLEYIVGDALKTGKELQEKFDIVYNDIDKEFYPETIEIANSRLRRGGMFITDNTLWGGKVILKGVHDEPTMGVIEFNNKLKNDNRFEISVLPFRDGVTIAVKK